MNNLGSECNKFCNLLVQLGTSKLSYSKWFRTALLSIRSKNQEDHIFFLYYTA